MQTNVNCRWLLLNPHIITALNTFLLHLVIVGMSRCCWSFSWFLVFSWWQPTDSFPWNSTKESGPSCRLTGHLVWKKEALMLQIFVFVCSLYSFSVSKGTETHRAIICRCKCSVAGRCYAENSMAAENCIPAMGTRTVQNSLIMMGKRIKISATRQILNILVILPGFLCMHVLKT